MHPMRPIRSMRPMRPSVWRAVSAGSHAVDKCGGLQSQLEQGTLHIVFHMPPPLLRVLNFKH